MKGKDHRFERGEVREGDGAGERDAWVPAADGYQPTDDLCGADDVAAASGAATAASAVFRTDNAAPFLPTPPGVGPMPPAGAGPMPPATRPLRCNHASADVAAHPVLIEQLTSTFKTKRATD